MESRLSLAWSPVRPRATTMSVPAHGPRTGTRVRKDPDAPALTRRAERTPEALKVTRTASRALNPCPFSIGPTIRSVGVILAAPVASRPYTPAAASATRRSSSSAVRFTEGVCPNPPAANRLASLGDPAKTSAADPGRAPFEIQLAENALTSSGRVAERHASRVAPRLSMKTTFCLIDWIKLEGNSKNNARMYTDCKPDAPQGLSPGWLDQYHHALED